MCNINTLSSVKNLPVTVQIRGKVKFSHISRPFEGAELVRANMRRKQFGAREINHPYSEISIEGAEFVDSPLLADPDYDAVKSYFTELLSEHVSEDGSSVYTGRNFSEYLPKVFYIEDGQKKKFDMDNHPLPAELATGLDVSVGVNVYRGKNGSVGLSIPYVIVNDELDFFKPTIENEWPKY